MKKAKDIFNFMREKVYCCFGHNKKGLFWDYGNKNDERHQQYLQALEDAVSFRMAEGYDYFICGDAIGVDADFAETVLRFKEKNPAIRLEIVVAYERLQDYTTSENIRLNRIFSLANDVIVLSDKVKRCSVEDKNRYMIEKANSLLIAWNGAKDGNTYSVISSAQKENKDVDVIHLPPFCDECLSGHISFSSATKWEKEKQENWELLKQRLGLSDPSEKYLKRKRR